MKFSLKKIEFEILMILFIIGLVFQNFSIVKTSDFGISFLTIVCLLLFVKYKMINKIPMVFILILTLSLVTSIMIFFVQIEYFVPIKIVRFFMVFFVYYVTARYTNILIFNNKIFKFLVIFKKIITLINIYGIYEFITYYTKWPLFLNFFSNNPSYGVTKNEIIFGGWIDLPRIRTVWFEPSAYGMFLCVAFLLFWIFRKSIKFKLYHALLMVINLIFTFSRSPILCFLMIGAIYLLVKSINKIKDNFIFNLIYVCVIFLPFFNLLLMSLSNKYLFSDLSSDARTMSPIFYLSKFFDNLWNTLFGYGFGSISIVATMNKNIKGLEGYAHNGYVQLLFEGGAILFGKLYN